MHRPANRPSFDSTREITVVTQFISARWKIHVSGAQAKVIRRFRREQSDGTYDFEYVCTKAGKVDLFIALQTKNPSSRTLNCVCKLWCEPSECRVDASKMLVQWLAGEPGIVRIQRRDRFGNPTRRSAKNGLNRFAAEVVGPAIVDCEALELGDGTCELRLQRHLACTKSMFLRLLSTVRI